MQKRRKEREDGEHVHLGDAEQLGRVHVIPVTEFVREDGFDFVGLALLDEGIKDDDVFALRGGERGLRNGPDGESTHPWETEKVGVAVRAAFRAVDLVDVFERKLELACECLGLGA